MLNKLMTPDLAKYSGSVNYSLSPKINDFLSISQSEVKAETYNEYK